MCKRVVIVANGRLYEQIIRKLKKGDIVIGVDRAAYWLLSYHIIPDVAIGDFDSTTEKEFSEIKKRVTIVRVYSPEKNYTDTELAVRWAVKYKPETITLYGASGSRTDHMLGSIMLFEYCRKQNIRLTVIDETNEIGFLNRGRTILERRGEYGYVSVIPITSSIQISLSGLKYELSRKTIHRGQTVGISNEFTGRQAVVTIHRGCAYIIQSKD